MKRPSLSRKYSSWTFFHLGRDNACSCVYIFIEIRQCQLWTWSLNLFYLNHQLLESKSVFFQLRIFLVVHSSSLNSNRIEHGVWYQFVMLPSYSSSLLELCATATTIIRYWPFFQSCFMLNCVPDWWVWILFWVTIFFYFNRVYTWWFLFQRGAKWSSSEQ